MRAGTLTRLGVAALGLAALAALGGKRAWADGAIAVGSTGNVVGDGIAFGMVVNEPKETAAATAVKRCRTFKARAAAERCEVVATFSGECFAVAYDPKPGTPGAGWGVGPDQLVANQKAVAMCERSAGPARKGYCQVESAGCDITGKGAGKAGGEAKTAAEPQMPAKSPAKPDAKTTAEVPAKSDAKTAAPDAASAVKTETAAVAAPASPPTPSVKPKAASGPAESKARSRGSPLLPVLAMAGVGLAYAAGQHLRGKLKGGLTETQTFMGGALAVAAAIATKLLDMAGAEQMLALALAGLIALGAAVLA